MTRRAGFTLMELLLASGLLAVVLLAFQQLYLQARRVAGATATGFDFDRATTSTLRRLERTLAAASPYLQPREEEDFRGDREDLRLVSHRAAGPGDELRGIVTVHLGQDGEGAFLEQGPPVWSAFEAVDSQGEGREVLRLPEVRSFEASYFDGLDWKPDWSFRRTLRLPRAIRLRLVLGRPVPGGLKEERTELVVPLPAERDVGIR